MEPVSVLAPLAKAILSQVGKELGGAASKGVKARMLGDPEQKALERALGRAFAEVEKTHGRRLADFDINAGFWVHEGASEMAKVLVPGVTPSAVRLAERAVDSLGRSRSDDERFDRITVLRPVFKALLDMLADELRHEPALRAVLGRSDTAQAAQAATRIAEHLGARAATEDDRVGYLRWLVDQHRYLRTAGLVRKTTVQLPLAEVFVGLRAHRDRHPGDRARVWFEREREKLAALAGAGQLDLTDFEAALDRLQAQYGRKFAPDGDQGSEQAVPVLDAVRDTAQVLVLGDPGTGKTTLLRYLALAHAKGLLAGTPVQGQAALFPIYVRIGEYARHGYPGVGISEFLPGYLSRSECRIPGLSDLLQRQLDAGQCLVLLDGLDEIASAELRRGVATAVANFTTANARQGNRFVVTSRIAGYQAAPLPEPFQAVRLQDMDDATITRFLDVYCREVERAETPGKTDAASQQAGSREATAIGQALAANAGVRRLAANPLLLTALVLVHRASGRLPHRRVEAYVEVCNALGRTWRSAQGVAEADLPDERILTSWLTELGSWLHEHRPEGAATKRELLEVLGPLWAEYQADVWDPGVLQAADPMRTAVGLGVIEFVEKADTHTGLLVERAPGRYGFAHLTFEEYYTGRALAFRGSAAERVTVIRRRLHDPRYDEPILLALGLIGTDYTEQVDDVVAKAIYPADDNPSPHEDLLGRDYLFMLRVLADDTPLKTATIDTIVNQAIDDWLTPEHSRCRFSGYRDALSQRLTALGGTKAGERFRIALDKRTTELTDAILPAWCQLAATATELGPLPATAIAMLVKIATGDADPSVRAGAGSALAAGGALTEPVIGVLVKIATGDSDPSVRAEAMSALAVGRALAAGRALIEPINGVLVKIATGDGDWSVRMRAGLELAAGGALTEPINGVLVKIAAGDADPSVRAGAVSALAAGGALTEPVIAALMKVGTGDADPSVRAGAVAALAAGGALTEPVKGVLVKIATGDADPSVRARAGSALAAGGALTEPVIAALVEIATGDADWSVPAEAVSALAAGRALTEPVIAALVEIATGDTDPLVRVRAGSALAAGGALTEPVIAALVKIATGDTDPYVRADAVLALAAGGALTEPVIAALMKIATSAESWMARQDAVRYLRHASPTRALRNVLVSLFKDSDNDVRREAGLTLVELSRQHPECAADIRSELAGACIDSTLNKKDEIEHRAGWDYAYEALRTHVESISQSTTG